MNLTRLLRRISYSCDVLGFMVPQVQQEIPALIPLYARTHSQGFEAIGFQLIQTDQRGLASLKVVECSTQMLVNFKVGIAPSYRSIRLQRHPPTSFLTAREKSS